MQTATFKTSKGNTIGLSIGTTRQLDADHTMTAPDWRLDLHVNGNRQIVGGLDLIDHPTHGKCLKAYMGGMMIPVPTDALADVEAVLGAYKAGVRRDVQAIVAADVAEEAARPYPRDARKAREWDRGINEGGDGYNPYR